MIDAPPRALHPACGAAPAPADDRAPFAARVIAWQRRAGRHDLPWQASADPYRIWLSEVMLQQTQVATVIPYFERFVTAFPDVAALAAAPVEEVLARWSGLGYYRRAAHLHAAAQRVVRDFGGTFPRDPATIASLPGIGRSTAAAIAAFAFGTRGAILDGNVKRVLARHGAIEGDPAAPVVAAALWRSAEALLPAHDIAEYTQGLMDLGATVCVRSRPVCGACPVAADCRARREARVHELPSPRRPREQPTRFAGWLVIAAGDAVLLERRPKTGVWSELWSLPELAPGEDAAAACQVRFGLAVERAEALAPIAHAFTHFRLVATPWCVRIPQPPAQAFAPGLQWFGPQAVADGALPAPIKRLLRDLARGGAGSGALPFTDA